VTPPVSISASRISMLLGGAAFGSDTAGELVG
jgi:hypothetical protein